MRLSKGTLTLTVSRPGRLSGESTSGTILGPREREGRGNKLKTAQGPCRSWSIELGESTELLPNARKPAEQSRGPSVTRALWLL